ncbi:MAG: repeat containing protein [Pedosphaera sp.]|nr:repeat containing protein [Pedosphaera sp.]
MNGSTKNAGIVFHLICRLNFFLVALALPLEAQVNYSPYAFTTIAGTASAGSVDGTNRAARFNEPQCAVVDASSNIFVADTVSSTIRKVSPNGTNWVVTTIAGVPNLTGSSDGVGSAALFSTPGGITMDTAGALYVADSGNQIIRKMVLNGSNWMVTTIAGSPGSYGMQDGTNELAVLGDPEGICRDAAGDLFVADYVNNAIRKITPVGTNWVVTTIAGQGQDATGHADGLNTNATFYYPRAITIDKNGNLFVGDGFNYLVRKMTPSGTNWMTTTIAGQLYQTGGDDGIGTNATFEFTTGLIADGNGNVFVADAEDYTIRELSPSGTNYAVTTPIGVHRVNGSADGTNSAASFFGPYGVTMDKNGALIICDTGNSEIRRATPSGTNWVVSTLAGFGQNVGSADGTNGAARFNHPFGLAVDASGNLFLADNANSTIRKISPSGTNWIVSTIAGRAQSPGFGDGLGTNAFFYYPDAVAVDSNGVVYVADAGDNVLRKLTPSGTNYLVTTIAGSNSIGSSVDGTNSVARFNGPSGVAVDAATNIYVADCYNATIRKVKPVGTNWVTTTIAGYPGVFSYAEGTGTNALFNYPRGIAVDKNGILYVADWNNYVIRMLTPSGTNYVSTTIAGANTYGSADGTNLNASFAAPYHIAVDDSGTLYVTDYNSQTVRKIVHAGTNWVVTTMGGIPGQYGSSDGVGPAALFNYPDGMAVDKNGVIYVAEDVNSTVVKGVAVPVIVISQPVVAAGLLQIPFRVGNAGLPSFKLLQTGLLGAPWTTNIAAVLATNIAGTSYKFTIPKPAANEFYRIQSP